MTAAARVDLEMALPQALAVVAAAARLAACESSIAETSRRTTAAVADTLAGMMLRDESECGTRVVVGSPPEVWDARLAAVRIGSIMAHHDARRANAKRRPRCGRNGGS